jgi:hypothetical protein
MFGHRVCVICVCKVGVVNEQWDRLQETHWELVLILGFLTRHHRMNRQWTGIVEFIQQARFLDPLLRSPNEVLEIIRTSGTVSIVIRPTRPLHCSCNVG